MQRFLSIFLLLAVLTSAGGVSFAQDLIQDEEANRRDYLAAIEALKAGQTVRFKTLYARLDGYILRGYLEYESIKNHVASTSASDLRRFLAENSQAPISDTIRKKWLRVLADRGDWKTFLKEYQDIEDDPELQCLRLSHLLKTSEEQAALMTEVEKLWLTGKELPRTCEPVFAVWKKAGHMTSDKVWARIRLAMESRNLRLAGELAQYLDPSERVWVKRWQAMHRDPVHELHNIAYPVETPVARMIVKHGVVRLAYRDPEEAMVQWGLLKQKIPVLRRGRQLCSALHRHTCCAGPAAAGASVVVGGVRRSGRHVAAPVAGENGVARRAMGNGQALHRGIERGAAARQPMALLDRADS